MFVCSCIKGMHNAAKTLNFSLNLKQSHIYNKIKYFYFNQHLVRFIKWDGYSCPSLKTKWCLVACAGFRQNIATVSQCGWITQLEGCDLYFIQPTGVSYFQASLSLLSDKVVELSYGSDGIAILNVDMDVVGWSSKFVLYFIFPVLCFSVIIVVFCLFERQNGTASIETHWKYFLRKLELNFKFRFLIDCMLFYIRKILSLNFLVQDMKHINVRFALFVLHLPKNH